MQISKLLRISKNRGSCMHLSTVAADCRLQAEILPAYIIEIIYGSTVPLPTRTSQLHSAGCTEWRFVSMLFVSAFGLSETAHPLACCICLYGSVGCTTLLPTSVKLWNFTSTRVMRASQRGLQSFNVMTTSDWHQFVWPCKGTTGC